jgi:hypothetical protein
MTVIPALFIPKGIIKGIVAGRASSQHIGG